MPHPVRSLMLGLLVAGAAPQGLLAQQVPAPAADIVVNMRGVEIADVADQISRLTGRTLILDPAVKGVVTVTSAEPLTAGGVWELFVSVLRANGFAAVRTGRAWRIVPAENAVRDGGARTRGLAGQELTTRMIRLSNVPAADAARVVRPLVATFGSVEPVASPNAIVVTDYADNVRRIEAIARSLDGGGGSTFATITLTNGSAGEVAQAMQSVLGESGTGAGARVAADTRSNTLIVRGTPASVAEARRIALALDRPGGATPVTRMFRLNYADAESVSEVLRGILGQEAQPTNPVARSIGRSSGSLGRPSIGQTLSQMPSAATLGAMTGAAAGTSAAQGGGNDAAAPVQGFSTPDLTVQPAPDLNAIVVRGTPNAVAGIEPLIRDLDIRRPQVMIEAAIAEVTGDDAEALAVQLGTRGAALSQYPGGATSFSQNGPSIGSILGLLGVPISAIVGEGLTANIGISDDFSILVQALGLSTKANLLSAPQVTVLDNAPAEIVVGQNVPFITGSILTNSSAVTPYTSIERKDVGLTLRVLPRVNAGETVRLEVSQEASSISSSVTGAADLITNRRAIDTTVLADNGQTIVLGGLISDDYMSSRRQVPVLGDIPIVGELFKSRRESHTKRTLFIFLKPTILRDPADAAAAAKERYARLRDSELSLGKKDSLLIRPMAPRLSVEIDGIY